MPKLLERTPFAYKQNLNQRFWIANLINFSQKLRDLEKFKCVGRLSLSFFGSIAMFVVHGYFLPLHSMKILHNDILYIKGILDESINPRILVMDIPLWHANITQFIETLRKGATVDKDISWIFSRNKSNDSIHSDTEIINAIVFLMCQETIYARVKLRILQRHSPIPLVKELASFANTYLDLVRKTQHEVSDILIIPRTDFSTNGILPFFITLELEKSSKLTDYSKQIIIKEVYYQLEQVNIQSEPPLVHLNMVVIKCYPGINNNLEKAVVTAFYENAEIGIDIPTKVYITAIRPYIVVDMLKILKIRNIYRYRVRLKKKK